MDDNKLSVIDTFTKKMAQIQDKICCYLSKENANENDYKNLVSYLKDEKVHESKLYLSSVLHLLSRLSNNYHHLPTFYDFFDLILEYFSSFIRQNFKNIEIFYIFKQNKRILLTLLTYGIIIPEESIYSIISSKKYVDNYYIHYFLPEFQEYISRTMIIKDDLSQTNFPEFESKRRIGEDDHPICIIIRNDSIQKFIEYTDKNDFPLTSQINLFDFETNTFLLKKKKLTLIEYAAFFGSIQIFKYLQMNEVELTPSLWLYAIHSNSFEMIHILEENNVAPNEKNSYLECFYESIKCHHNKIANYIQNLLLSPSEINKKEILMKALKYYNFELVLQNLSDLNIKDIFLSENIDYIRLLYDIKPDKKTLLQYKESEISCLNNAIQKNKLEIVYLLFFRLYADINKQFLVHMSDQNTIKITPLVLAIENEHIEIVKLLLSHPSIDVNGKSIYKISDKHTTEKTPLSLAVEKQNLEIMELLFSQNKLDIDLMLKTVKYNDKDTIKTEELMTAFHFAIVNYKYKTISLFLKQKFDINKKIITKKYSKQTFPNLGNECYNNDYYKKEEESNATSEIPIANYAINNKNFNAIKLLFNTKQIDFNAKQIDVGYSNKIFVKKNDSCQDDNSSLNENDNSKLCMKESSNDEKNECIENTQNQQDAEDLKNSRINPNAKSSFKKEVIIDKKQNQKYFIEESVLHLAVKKRKKNTIKNLLSFPNVQVDIKDNDCKTPKDYIDQSDDKMMDLFNKKK